MNRVFLFSVIDKFINESFLKAVKREIEATHRGVRNIHKIRPGMKLDTAELKSGLAAYKDAV